MDYKDSLLLPKTTFEMRGNLPQNEPLRYKKWDEDKIYKKMIENRVQREEFNLHDGPPYANGNTHIGHALNKVLKDIIIKFHYFNGKSTKFVVGWDCHGLPIEQQVEKKLGKEKKDSLAKEVIRRLCREHASKFIEIQKDEFKSLGILADFENPYKTMDFKFEADIYKTLTQVAKRGLLLERNKPVYWSWAAKTALAEAEVEYEDRVSPSIYVAFKLDSEANTKLEVKNAKIVIWTTTPWTLPANTGISLNPFEDYVLTQNGFIVAKPLHQKLVESAIVDSEIIKTFKANILENLFAINPLNNRTSKIVLGEHVLMDSGTGAVHTAPGHGEDDYRVGLKYNLDVIMPVDESGNYDESVVKLNLFANASEFVGINVFEANEKILALLGEALLRKSDLTHSYPHCWRTHKPIIFRATKQWFIALDKKIEGENKTLREIALGEIEKIKFYPEVGKNRLKSMIENRPDWCISRQRDWGVPIAFFRDKTTKEVIFDEKVLNYLIMIFEKMGADAWWSMEIKDLLNPASGYNPDNLEKVLDILDVWFDSGSTWNAVLNSNNYDSGTFPADLYLEGSDQHRGWFQSSLLVSCAINSKAPYKAILTHGFTVDEKGEKMSKSKGNVVAPEDVLKKYGSEVLRLWVAMSDYHGDLKISDNILKQISEQYRKLRNTFRFLLANIDDLDEIVGVEKFSDIDRWILFNAKKVFDEAHSHFSEYEFSKGLNLLNNFIVNELSGIYLDICKDRLYCEKTISQRRRASQSAMALITKSLLGLVAPILTYTMDEVIQNAPKVIKSDKNSIFDFEYEALAVVVNSFDNEYMIEAREKFFEIVDKLKKEKKIKSTLELKLFSDNEKFKTLDKTDLEDWFIVSEIVSEDDILGDIGNFKIKNDNFRVLMANKFKCPRCWKLNSIAEDTLCERCDEVINA